MTIDVNTSTRDQMLNYARAELGLDVKGNISKAELIDLLARQTDQQVMVQTGGGDTNPEQTTQVAKHMRSLRGQKKVEVFVYEDPRHPKRIPVNINGVRYTLKPGAWCRVPESVAKVLADAVQGHISTYLDDQGKVHTTRRTSLQFPFQMREIAA